MRPLELYHSLVADACASGPPARRTPVTFEVHRSDDPLLISVTGFYPNRWVKFCDDYLNGGPSYDLWLQDSSEPYPFSNGAHHSRGSCLVSASVESRTLMVKSRACLLVPVGILDLKLIQLTMTRLDVPRALWTIGDLQVDPMTVFSYSGYDDLPHTSALAKRADAALDGVSDAQLSKYVPGLLGRHKKAIRRARERIQTDESHIAGHFTYATPREFTWLDRGIRESWVREVTGPRGHGEYQYPTLDALELVTRRLGYSPEIAALAEMRAGRQRPRRDRWGTDRVRARAAQASSTISAASKARPELSSVCQEVGKQAAYAREWCRRAEAKSSEAEAADAVAKASRYADLAAQLVARHV